MSVGLVIGTVVIGMPNLRDDIRGDRGRLHRLERREAHLRVRLDALCATVGHGETSIVIVRGHVQKPSPTGCAPLP